MLQNHNHRTKEKIHLYINYSPIKKTLPSQKKNLNNNYNKIISNKIYIVQVTNPI